MEGEAAGDDLNIIHTTDEDAEMIDFLFQEGMKLKRDNGYRVWDVIDYPGLARDRASRLQYKVQKKKDTLGVFSVQYEDPLVWRDRDRDRAIYLHRIVANPFSKGQRLFEIVLHWAIKHAREKRVRLVRLDTWSENRKLIEYYKSYGFRFVENYTTPDSPHLPLQNRNITVSLLQWSLEEY
jgi:ribosomal protein S18 acetylase RimI-like enzyme